MKIIRPSDAPVRVDDKWHFLYGELFRDFWQKEFPTALYSLHDQHYQRLYTGRQLRDESFLVEHEGKVLASCVVAFDTYHKDLSGFGRPIVAVIKNKRAGELLVNELKGLRKTASGIQYWDFLDDGVSLVSKVLLKDNVEATPTYHQIIDLSGTIEELYTDVRKSYKNLINKGKEKLDYRIIDKTNISSVPIQQFRSIHHEKAGRHTRSKETWDNQQFMAIDKQMFMVMGYDDELRSASMFYYNNKSAYYAVGSYKTDAHAGIWLAIEHCKKLGLETVDMGEMDFKSLRLSSISGFKRGFGGKLKARLLFK